MMAKKKIPGAQENERMILLVQTGNFASKFQGSKVEHRILEKNLMRKSGA
jgi:hypothetical protein